MNPSPFAKRQIILLAVLFCSIAFLLAIADRAPIHMEKRYPSAHVREEFTFYLDGIVQKTLPGPLVYRVLMPWTITGLQTIAPFMSPLDIDLMMKIFILVVCQASFYFYTRLFFPPFVSLAGVFLLDSLLGFALASIQGPSLIETSDLFNLAIYVLALIALSLNSFRSLLVILFIGTFNRESTWLILPILFVSDFKNRRKRIIVQAS